MRAEIPKRTAPVAAPTFQDIATSRQATELRRTRARAPEVQTRTRYEAILLPRLPRPSEGWQSLVVCALFRTASLLTIIPPAALSPNAMYHDRGLAESPPEASGNYESTRPPSGLALHGQGLKMWPGEAGALRPDRPRQEYVSSPAIPPASCQMHSYVPRARESTADDGDRVVPTYPAEASASRQRLAP